MVRFNSKKKRLLIFQGLKIVNNNLIQFSTSNSLNELPNIELNSYYILKKEDKNQISYFHNIFGRSQFLLTHERGKFQYLNTSSNLLFPKSLIISDESKNIVRIALRIPWPNESEIYLRFFHFVIYLKNNTLKYHLKYDTDYGLLIYNENRTDQYSVSKVLLPEFFIIYLLFDPNCIWILLNNLKTDNLIGFVCHDDKDAKLNQIGFNRNTTRFNIESIYVYKINDTSSTELLQKLRLKRYHLFNMKYEDEFINGDRCVTYNNATRNASIVYKCSTGSQFKIKNVKEIDTCNYIINADSLNVCPIWYSSSMSMISNKIICQIKN